MTDSATDWIERLAKAYKTLPATHMRPEILANRVIDGMLTPDHTAAEYDELREMLVGAAIVWMELLSSTRALEVFVDATDHIPDQVKLEAVK